MAGIDLTTAQAHLDHWLAIELNGGEEKSVTFSDGSSATYHSPAEVSRQIDKWSRMVQRLSRGSGVSGQRVVIHD